MIGDVLRGYTTRIFVYIDGTGLLLNYGTVWEGGDFSTAWHTFGLEWQSYAITWYMDGVERSQYDGSDIAAEPLYLILNLQVGGKDSWSGPAEATTVFPAYYDIDYVHVWQKAEP